MKYKAFSIRNITNMHVGTGDTTFGVVDKLVQRDPITEYPIIYSSSLKGAIREYFMEYLDMEYSNMDLINYVFGKDSNNSGQKNNEGKTTSGNYRFFQANLLAIPVRSNVKPYFMATTPSLLKDFLTNIKTFGIVDNKIDKNQLKEIDKNQLKEIEKLSMITPDEKSVLIKGELKAKIEDWKTKNDNNIPENIKFLGSNIALFSENNFKQLVQSLPVIARNNLENGQSKNLWYEEIVPRESRFYFIVGFGQEYENEFKKKLEAGNVQIGGNASIGYGFTKIEEINTANGGNNE